MRVQINAERAEGTGNNRVWACACMCVCVYVGVGVCVPVCHGVNVSMYMAATYVWWSATMVVQKNAERAEGMGNNRVRVCACVCVCVYVGTCACVYVCMCV